MSSVLVKGMKMPENCMDCKIKQYDEFENYHVCPFSGVMCLSIGRQDACPLVALPDKHGRLVDADALEKEGWSLHRTIRVDKNTEEYQTKPLRQVPTIEPQRKKGRWILVKGSNGKDYHKCSECLHMQEITGVKNYCAVCGTEMEGEECQST